MANKSIKEIAWNATEEEYRRDPALSYSTIARFDREGFNGLSKLFDKLESPSLTFGSVVDTLITGTPEEFKERYMVADITVSDAIARIVKRLFAVHSEEYKELRLIPEETMLNTIADIQWNNHWLPRTRAKKILEDGAAYYKLLYIAEGKEIISVKLNEEAERCVHALKNKPATRLYFAEDPFNDNIERVYQLKFKTNLYGMDFRCMFDELVIIHDKKMIVPVDLKTSSKNEWDFYKSFIEWSYSHQARLYSAILKKVIANDPYFCDFKIAPYKFIVVNKLNAEPLVWSYADNFKTGPLTYGKRGEVTVRDPFVVAKELTEYLKAKHIVPLDISMTEPQDLVKFLNSKL